MLRKCQYTVRHGSMLLWKGHHLPTGPVGTSRCGIMVFALGGDTMMLLYPRSSATGDEATFQGLSSFARSGASSSSLEAGRMLESILLRLIRHPSRRS